MEGELKTFFEKLIDSLRELRDLHEQLLLAVRNKQRTMREGDMSGLESWSAREQFLTARIQEVDTVRSEANEQLGIKLGFQKTPRLSELASKLGEPERSKLLAFSGALRETAEKIRQVNQVNDAVTREILSCFAEVQQRIASAQSDIGLYDPNGHKKSARNFNILDAVG